MNFDRGGWIAVGILIIAFSALVYMYTRSLPQTVPVSVPESPRAISARFSCEDEKNIEATFTNGSVLLKLSDGRQLSLPRAASASGARYANSDDSFVFWNNGNGAIITELGTSTYHDCLAPTL